MLESFGDEFAHRPEELYEDWLKPTAYAIGVAATFRAAGRLDCVVATGRDQNELIEQVVKMIGDAVAERGAHSDDPWTRFLRSAHDVFTSELIDPDRTWRQIHAVLWGQSSNDIPDMAHRTDGRVLIRELKGGLELVSRAPWMPEPEHPTYGPVVEHEERGDVFGLGDGPGLGYFERNPDEL